MFGEDGGFDLRGGRIGCFAALNPPHLSDKREIKQGRKSCRPSTPRVFSSLPPPSPPPKWTFGQTRVVPTLCRNGVEARISVSCSAACTQYASDSAEEASAQAAGRLGFSGPGGSVSGRVQRAVHGVDLATDAGPVSILQDPAGPTGAGLCHTFPKKNKKTKTKTMYPVCLNCTHICTDTNIDASATQVFLM